jgi:predicted metal-dependent hydrolase
MIELEGRDIAFAVVRSSRSRRVRLRLDIDPVVKIVTPLRCPPLEVSDLLQPHRYWIIEHLDRLRDQRFSPLEAGSTVRLLGEDMTLALEHSDTARVMIEGEKLRIFVPSFDEQEIVGTLRSWYRLEAASKLRERVDHWSAVLGVKSLQLTIRDQRTRWGSCSARGRLSFSWRLILAPFDVLDYVVLHEVAHLREHNHSKRFWAIVSEQCPDYQSHREWLRQEGPALSGFLR